MQIELAHALASDMLEAEGGNAGTCSSVCRDMIWCNIDEYAETHMLYP